MSEPLISLENIPGWLVEDLTKIFQHEQHVESVTAAVRANKTERALLEDRNSIDGLGQPYLEVDDYSYHYWGQRLGYKCWKDKKFLREYHRDNPSARVKAMGTKLQWGYQAPDKKFSKHYG